MKISAGVSLLKQPIHLITDAVNIMRTDKTANATAFIANVVTTSDITGSPTLTLRS